MSLNDILYNNFSKGGTNLYPFKDGHNFSNVFNTEFKILNTIADSAEILFDKVDLYDDKGLSSYLGDDADVTVLAISNNLDRKRYHLAKIFAKLNGKKIQFIEERNLLGWKENESSVYRSPFLIELAVQLLAKAGGTPWILELGPGGSNASTITEPLARNSLVIGISFATLAENLAFGVAMFLNLKNLDQKFAMRTFKATKDMKVKGYYLPQDIMKEVIEKALEWAKSANLTPSHLFIYKTSPIHDEELRGMSEFSSIDWALIHVKTSGTLLRLYDEEEKEYMVRRGVAIISQNHKVKRCGMKFTAGRIIMTTTGLAEKPREGYYRTLGTPRSIELEVYSNYDIDLRLIANQVIALTKVDWECTKLEKREPAILKYSRRMAQLASVAFESNYKDTIEKQTFDVRDLM